MEWLAGPLSEAELPKIDCPWLCSELCLFAMCDFCIIYIYAI